MGSHGTVAGAVDRPPATVPTSGLGDLHGLHGEAHRCPLLVLELELDERRPRAQVQTFRFDVRACDRDRLHGLVHGVRADRLDLDFPLVSKERGDGPGDGVGSRRSGDA